ncbi:MAG: serine/threonine-protein kinase [bacterium]
MTSHSDADFITLQEALAGEYSLDRELGRGGMGIVYLAREVRLARSVAIKVLPPALAARRELRDAFLRESQTAAGLNHPNIVPVYAVGESGGFVYIVMAFVDGTTLGERLRTKGPLLPGQAARMLREVAWALAYAHAAGIVHRDVSAENILLERGTDRAIVMDFGIASAMRTSAVADDGRVMGNAYYVSPEQAMGEPVDARSDLYSLGVCGYYALTGRLPFDARTPAEIVTLHITAPALPVATVATATPIRLAQAVDRCLAKDPAERFRSAESFAEAIDLAFEHARGIPAPLRVWITQGEREAVPRALLLMWGMILGPFAAMITHDPWVGPLPLLVMGGLSVVPIITRLRHLLAEGYDVADLHSALREHDLARTEEEAYQRRFASSAMGPALRVMFVGSLSALSFLGWLSGHNADVFAESSALIRGSSVILASAFAVISMVGLATGFIRHRLAAPLAGMKVNFWKGKWGARFARLASVGLGTVEHRALGMPLLTEVALGRATDHLYRALPRETRKELADLPEIVRRLERDATALRSSIDAIDDQLSVFDRAAARSRPTSVHASPIEEDLRSTRGTAAEQLAATVAALENVRLGLLRLRIGSARVESVTASLDAAHRVGEQIDLALEARDEVERVLRSPTPKPRVIDVTEDDDADTPVQGVPAARG